MNFSVFHHLQKDKQRKHKATHDVKLDKKRPESSKRNQYIISARVIIKAIIIIRLATGAFPGSDASVGGSRSTCRHRVKHQITTSLRVSPLVDHPLALMM